jgi:hypothetical protein
MDTAQAPILLKSGLGGVSDNEAASPQCGNCGSLAMSRFGTSAVQLKPNRRWLYVPGFEKARLVGECDQTYDGYLQHRPSPMSF